MIVSDKVVPTVARISAALPRNWADFGTFLTGRPWEELEDGLDGPSRSLLLDLYRHMTRQAFVGRVVREKLGTDLLALGTWGAIGRPATQPQLGRVPEVEGWSFYFHGMGCRLTHDDGTCVDVDFHDGRSDRIDPFFYVGYLCSVPAPSFVQQRLVKPEPFGKAWMADLPNLLERGFLEGESSFGLTLTGVRYGKALDAALPADADATPAQIVAMGFLLGLADVELTTVLAEYRPLVVDARRKEAETRCERHLRQLEQLSDATQRAHALLSAAASCPRKASLDVRRLLAIGSFDVVLSVAVTVAETMFDESWVRDLEVLLNRASGTDAPRPHVRVRAARLILSKLTPLTLRTQTRKTLERALRQPAGSSSAEAAQLLYLLDPGAGREALEKLLVDQIPANRLDSAATLCCLAAVDFNAAVILSNASSPETSYARAIELGLDIAPIHPKGEMVELLSEQLLVYQWEDVSLANLPDWVRGASDEIAREYAPLLERWRPELAKTQRSTGKGP